jgi:hypothetical protein
LQSRFFTAAGVVAVSSWRYAKKLQRNLRRIIFHSRQAGDGVDSRTHAHLHEASVLYQRPWLEELHTLWVDVVEAWHLRSTRSAKQQK